MAEEFYGTSLPMTKLLTMMNINSKSSLPLILKICKFISPYLKKKHTDCVKNAI